MATLFELKNTVERFGDLIGVKELMSNLLL